jgi:excisionase family DNA binding protein
MTFRAKYLSQLVASHRANAFDASCHIWYKFGIMNKEEAAEELGISVRSLQRLAQSKKISVTYKRGESGKQEAIFNPEEIEKYKQQRDIETVKQADATTNDTALARNDTHQFLEILRNVITPEQKTVSVAIADKPLLKLDEAAALTGLSRDILRKAIDTKELKGKMIGRAYRIKRDDLDRYITNL